MNKFYVIIIIILIASLSFLIVALHQVNNEYIKLSSNLEKNSLIEQKSSEKYRILAINTKNQYRCNNTKIKDIYVAKPLGDSIKLSSIINNKPKLIFRFKETDCNICIENALNDIREIYRIVGAQNIIILANYYNVRSFISFFNSNKMNVMIYNTSSKELGIPIESLDTPYFAIVDAKLIAHSIVIPAKELDGFTKDCLLILCKNNLLL